MFEVDGILTCNTHAPPPKTHSTCKHTAGWESAKQRGNARAVPYLACLLHKAADENRPGSQSAPRGSEGGGRSACRVWAGPASAQKLPQSDFPAAELQPSPCPCLKNFLNSIPVLFLTALKPYSVCTSIRLCQANSELLGCLQLSMGNTCVKHRLAPLQRRPWRLPGSHSQPQRKGLLEPVPIVRPFSRFCSVVWDAGEESSAAAQRGPFLTFPLGPPG